VKRHLARPPSTESHVTFAGDKAKKGKTKVAKKLALKSKNTKSPEFFRDFADD
jgi:hypothetical protein